MSMRLCRLRSDRAARSSNRRLANCPLTDAATVEERPFASLRRATLFPRCREMGLCFGCDSLKTGIEVAHYEPKIALRCLSPGYDRVCGHLERNDHADVMCRGKSLASHTSKCATMPNCAKSGFGVVLADGKFLKFDEAGNAMALKRLKAPQRQGEGSEGEGHGIAGRRCNQGGVVEVQ